MKDFFFNYSAVSKSFNFNLYKIFAALQVHKPGKVIKTVKCYTNNTMRLRVKHKLKKEYQKLPWNCSLHTFFIITLTEMTASGNPIGFK